MSIYQHFRKEEKVFIDSCLQWRSYVEKYYSPKLTTFLTPREQQIVSALIGKNNECKVQFFGGHVNAERKRAIIYPEYYELSDADFEITLLNVSYNQKFNELQHRQILGTLMSLGLTRDKFGDVLIGDGDVQILVAEDISEYVITNVVKIGSAGVKLSRLQLVNAILVENNWQESTTTASSLRIDSILSSMTNFSRNKAQEWIDSGKVKVNHEDIEERDFECGTADLISVRGLGRFKIISIEGKTKKDKLRIKFGKLK